MKSHLKAVIALYERLYSLRETVPNDDASEEQLAAVNLFRFASFRLPAAADKKPLIGFSLMKAAMMRCLRSPVNSLNLEKAEGIIISSSSCDHSNAQHYIRSMSGKNNLAYLIKDKLSFRAEFSAAEWIRWFFFAFRQSFRAMVSPHRSNVALTIIEVLEISLVLKWLHAHKLNEIYDFVPFEVDSNAMFLSTRAQGARTTKIPSPGPLSTHNKIMLCDALVLSGGYHFEEIDQLRRHYRIGNFLSWPPERAHTYYDLYTKEKGVVTPKMLGFYSHGEWIRMKNGLIKGNTSLLHAEEDALRLLGVFLKEHPDFRLTIYPHPKERKSCSIKELEDYYSQMTGASAIHIADASKGTTFRFRESDIAITCYSTIIFERLYAGFKTIIKRIEGHDFPLATSPLNHICFDDYAQLSALIMDVTKKSNGQFIEMYRLEKYVYPNFPSPINKNE